MFIQYEHKESVDKLKCTHIVQIDSAGIIWILTEHNNAGLELLKSKIILNT